MHKLTHIHTHIHTQCTNTRIFTHIFTRSRGDTHTPTHTHTHYPAAERYTQINIPLGCGCICLFGYNDCVDCVDNDCVSDIYIHSPEVSTHSHFHPQQRRMYIQTLSPAAERCPHTHIFTRSRDVCTHTHIHPQHRGIHTHTYPPAGERCAQRCMYIHILTRSITLSHTLPTAESHTPIHILTYSTGSRKVCTNTHVHLQQREIYTHTSFGCKRVSKI